MGLVLGVVYLETAILPHTQPGLGRGMRLFIHRPGRAQVVAEFHGLAMDALEREVGALWHTVGAFAFAGTAARRMKVETSRRCRMVISFKNRP
ncbi:hypothetical protein [Curvibacter fontanus]